MNRVFSEELLAEKLSKANTTQLCIETLSHWCIFNRSKAEVVVSTWVKQFHSLKMVQKVALLYLANDILQNSKRNGNEFVSAFWNVLPSAFKPLLSDSDERGKKAILRLVDIWEERKVFGSRARVKEVMLGDESPVPLELNGNKKRPRSIKITKRDSRSIRTKLTVGGAPEKIVSAFHLMLSEQSNEDSEMSKCNSTVSHVRKLEKDVENACSNPKDPKRKSVAMELEENENVLKQCVEKLKSVEAIRLALISQLKEALHEQESELEIIRTQMQVAGAQAEEAKKMKKRLEDEEHVSSGTQKSAASIAALVADRLAASTSSQLIMTSVLSSFAAEEAKSAGLEKPVSVSVPSSSSSSDPTQVFSPYQQSAIQYHMTNPNPNPNQNPSQQQYMASPYGFAGAMPPPLPPGPPPPPPPPHMLSPMVPLNMASQQQQQAQAGQGFRPLQPPGMVYYNHPRQ